MKVGNIFFSTSLKEFYTLNWYKKEATKGSGDISFTVNIYPILGLFLVFLYFSKKKR